MKPFGQLLALLILAGAGAQADIPYEDPAGQGTQAWNGNLALTFSVLTPIDVTGLGVFNAAGNGIISSPIQVVIYNTQTNTAVTPVVTFLGPYATGGLGYDVFQSIAPVVLGPGSYEVDAVGFGLADLNGNLNTGSSSGPVLNNLGGALAFTGAAYDGSLSLDDPLSCGACQGPPLGFSQFDAGTFEAGSPSSVTPEPTYVVLIPVLLIPTVLAYRRRHARSV